jgi:hypothetical protein
MEYYPEFVASPASADNLSLSKEQVQIAAMGKLISRLITRITQIHVSDIHDENVHNNGGNAIIIDWGY